MTVGWSNDGVTGVDYTFGNIFGFCCDGMLYFISEITPEDFTFSGYMDWLFLKAYFLI